MYRKHLKSLLLHKWYVFLAGLKVGGIPIWRLIVHDLSKFSRFEFKQYAQHFHGSKKDELGFASAWLHHENNNPHHWGYHIPRSGKYAGKPLPMPLTYVKEMMADWMGAGRTYTGSWDMSEWLENNLPGIWDNCHELTKTHIFMVLFDMGYGKIVESIYDRSTKPRIAGLC